MVLELCGGAASEVTEAGARPVWSREAKLRFARLKSFGGSEIDADEAVASLERLGFTRARAHGGCGARGGAELAQ